MPKLRIERIIEVKERLFDDKRKEMESITVEIERIVDEIYDADSCIETNYNKMASSLMDGNEMYLIKEYIIYLENRKHDLFLRKEDLKTKANTKSMT